MIRWRVALSGMLCLLAANLARGQYGDISDLKIAKAEDKVDVKETPAPEGAVTFTRRGLRPGAPSAAVREGLVCHQLT